MTLKRGLALATACALFMPLANAAKAQVSVRGQPAIASYHALGRCLDVRAADRQVLSWACHGGANQAFRFVSGSYGMISLGTQSCLTSGLVSGGAITAQPCTNAVNQRWGFQPNGTLRSENGMCLDIEGGSTANGARVLGFACHGGSNQQWYPAVTAPSASIGPAGILRMKGRTGVRSYLSSSNFSGGNIIAAAGGTIVAGGAGNLIANDGASIVSGGAGNLLARAGGSLLANDGASIVAGGAGNLLPGAWSFFSGAGAGALSGN